MNTKEELIFTLYCNSHEKGIDIELVEESCKSSEFEKELYFKVSEKLGTPPENVDVQYVKKALIETLPNMDSCWPPYECDNPQIELIDRYN